ncbi:MAG: hypothetical protein KIT84_34460 [Labilithrix sp.]|nr:hypothetical protein [Labilithrix sp.]
MTSEVMVFMTERAQNEGMKKRSPLVPLLVLVPFTVFSVVCAYEGRADGLRALSHPWAMQVGLDLVISCFLVGGWIRRDAREHGISALPFLVLLPLLGSIAALLYLVRRAWSRPPTSHPVVPRGALNASA